MTTIIKNETQLLYEIAKLKKQTKVSHMHTRTRKSRASLEGYFAAKQLTTETLAPHAPKNAKIEKIKTW